MGTLTERFWAKVDMAGPVVRPELGRCWVWTAGKHNGYGAIGTGSMKDGTRRMTPAHRVSWALHMGAEPGRLEVCHRCDNPACVRPAHLFLGTMQDNMADKVAKGRQARGAALGNRRGERNANAKLSDFDASVIADSCGSSGMLSSIFGVDVATISRARRGSVWSALQRSLGTHSRVRTER